MTPAAPLRSLLACTLLLAVTACHDDDPHRRGGAGVPAAPDYWPTDAWITANPAAHGFRSGALDDLAAAADTALPYYTSLLVVKDGYLVHESYHTPDTMGTPVTVDTKHQLWSVSKSVTSMVTGVAWTRGDLLPGDLDTTADETFGTLIADLDAAAPQRGISLRHALLMRSGIRWNEDWDFTLENPLFYTDADCPAGNGEKVCTVLHRDQRYEPGTVWNYNTWDTYLAASFFRELTGTPLGDYAGTHLFAPLGIDYLGSDWGRVPSGSPYTFGGAGLQLKSRDIARLGMLMLYDGRWEDAQLLATDWLDLSLAAQGPGLIATFEDASPNEPADPVAADIAYGMQWWLANAVDAPVDGTLSARGLAGQLIHVFPDDGLVVIVTCAFSGHDGRFAEIHAFIDEHIVGALR